MYTFDAKEATEKIVNWIRQFFEENGKGCNAVVAISGGKDSSVVAGLCCKALGKDRVIGVLMPNGVQADINCAQQLCDFLKIKHFIINIEGAFQSTIKQLTDAGIELSDQTKTDLLSDLMKTQL